MRTKILVCTYLTRFHRVRAVTPLAAINVTYALLFCCLCHLEQDLGYVLGAVVVTG